MSAGREPRSERIKSVFDSAVQKAGVKVRSWSAAHTPPSGTAQVPIPVDVNGQHLDINCEIREDNEIKLSTTKVEQAVCNLYDDDAADKIAGAIKNAVAKEFE
jgi:hypothetical protein